jgi:hypothetical protein
MRSGFASFDQMVPVNNWPQVIDQFDVSSRNLTAIKPTGPNYHHTSLLIHIRSFIPNSFYFMLFSTCRLLCQSSLFHWANKSGHLLQSCVAMIEHKKVAPPSRILLA